MKYKRNDWLNTEDRSVLYGIDAYFDGDWGYCSEGNKPLLFADPKARDIKLDQLRKAERTK